MLERACRPSKAEQRVKTALARSPLRIFSSDGGVQKQGLELGVRDFSKTAAAIFEKFMCSFNDRRRKEVFESIDDVGVVNLIKTAQLLAERPEAGGRIVFRTVFGATECMPIRALSYILPSVYILEGLMGLNSRRPPGLKLIQLPQLQFLFMNEAGVSLNGIDLTAVNEETQLFINTALAYLQQFHPDVLPYVSFADDVGFTDSVMKTDLFNFLTAFLKEGMTGEPLERLKEMAVNHGSNAEAAFSYAGLHSLVHDGMFTDGSFCFRQLAGAEPISNPLVVDLLISVGAQPESFFYLRRGEVRPRLTAVDSPFSLADTTQYLTSHTIPPYLMLANGDLSLRDVLEEPSRLSQALRDVAGWSEVQPPVRQAVERLQNDAGHFNLGSFFNS